MPARKFKRKQYRVRHKPGRKTRPWLESPLPYVHVSMYLYPRHLALIQALEPYALEDLQLRMETALVRERIDGRRDYIPESASRQDVLLYALEMACRRLHLDIEQIVSDYTAQEQRKQFRQVLFGEED